jgi:hypothetical protein
VEQNTPKRREGVEQNTLKTIGVGVKADSMNNTPN